ncbi:16520_t:CDS:1 [Cetraspora pellucida]|uniref:16520_t:CDS:1 n=1 Tax=Cetraspora pellucida TaxID=1433469 RepID=A0ACA9MAR0_9GLOM|nr:16520_t:CDS:1 [Cetraspora pellucida]
MSFKEILLQKENEYLLGKINEELKEWKKNNYESAKATVISIIVSSLSLLFGVFLFIFEKSTFAQEFKNTISTSVIGTGGSVTLLGSLAGLKNLFKEANEQTEEFKKVLDMFKRTEDETKGESATDEYVQKLEEHYMDQKRIYKFLEGLNQHMRFMSICRTVIVTITSLAVLMLALVSVFYLVLSDDEFIFEIIDILLIICSSLILYYSICVMILIQFIIPFSTEEMLAETKWTDSKDGSNDDPTEETNDSTNKAKKKKPFGAYDAEVDLRDLLKFFFHKIKSENNWLSKLIKIIELIIFVLFMGCFFMLGLMSLNLKLRRIAIGNSELEGINRVIYGLPLKESVVDDKR